MQTFAWEEATEVSATSDVADADGRVAAQCRHLARCQVGALEGLLVGPSGQRRSSSALHEGEWMRGLNPPASSSDLRRLIGELADTAGSPARPDFHTVGLILR